MFVWLVSYPKSGNTWLRIFLSNYRNDGDEPAKLDTALLGSQIHLSRHLFDETMGLTSSELSDAEITYFRHKFHQQFVEKYEGTTFTKAHEAYSSAFPSSERCRAIYVVRNPLDIAPSFAHHEGYSIDKIISHMDDRGAHVRHGETAFDEHIGRWSQHVTSWAEQDALDTLIIRYEDMIDDPVQTFGKIVEFSRFELDQSKLHKALDQSRFDRLQAEEAATGFLERPQYAEKFFRSGQAGGWKGALTEQQIAQISSDHQAAMQMFGYV